MRQYDPHTDSLAWRQHCEKIDAAPGPKPQDVAAQAEADADTLAAREQFFATAEEPVEPEPERAPRSRTKRGTSDAR